MLWMMVAVTTLLAVAPAAPQSNATQNSGAMCNAPNEAALRSRSPTNDEINAAEVGNPDSLDYKDRLDPARDENSRAKRDVLEAGNPHKVQDGDSPAKGGPC